MRGRDHNADCVFKTVVTGGNISIRKKGIYGVYR